MKINVHAGHNAHTPGSSSLLNEVKEDRIVKNEVIRLLKAKGHTVYDCTDDVGRTEDDNLYNIVIKCNKHTVNLGIAIHLNWGRKDLKGDDDTGGVEVFIYDKSSNSPVKEAERVADSISKKLGIRNRGVKVANYYVLRETKEPAMLVECCFVDDKDDAEKWNAKKCAEAIVEGLLNITIGSSNDPVAVVEYMTINGNKRYMNVYQSDKLVKTSKHGRYNQELTIGTTGARNCFGSYKNGKACGKSYDTKPKGTVLMVKNVKDLK